MGACPWFGPPGRVVREGLRGDGKGRAGMPLRAGARLGESPNGGGPLPLRILHRPARARSRSIQECAPQARPMMRREACARRKQAATAPRGRGMANLPCLCKDCTRPRPPRTCLPRGVTDPHVLTSLCGHRSGACRPGGRMNPCRGSSIKIQAYKWVIAARSRLKENEGGKGCTAQIERGVTGLCMEQVPSVATHPDTCQARRRHVMMARCVVGLMCYQPKILQERPVTIP
eukprot:366503-Chlamydomonas_euryale.AAC.15